MGLTTYIFILFGISIAFYFAGYQPLLFQLFQCPAAGTPGGGGLAACSEIQNPFSGGIINQIFALITNPAFLISIGLAAFVPFLTGGNFSVLYVIPIAILFALSNFLILPTSFLLSVNMPVEISVILLGFMNLWLMLIVVEFIRGGE